jgi:hypothetical protein
MKKFVAVLVIICFAFVMVSCSTIKIECKNGYAYLAPDNNGAPKAKTVRSKMVFYILFGLVPLTDNSTGDMIRPKEIVRVKTYSSFIDYLIDCVLGIVTISVSTIDVEVIK